MASWNRGFGSPGYCSAMSFLSGGGLGCGTVRRG